MSRLRSKTRFPSSNDEEQYNGPNGNDSYQYANSNLQASALEFHPTNRNQYDRSSRPNSYRQPHQQLHVDAEEFHPRNYNGVKKKTFSNRGYQARRQEYNREPTTTANQYNEPSHSRWRNNNQEDEARFPKYRSNNHHRFQETNHSFRHNQEVPKKFNKSYTRPLRARYERPEEDVKKPTKTTANQRERLTEMIDGNLLECLVCCEKIKRSDKIWSCAQCYHIIHLQCISAWAESSLASRQNNWRCPACQNFYIDIPKLYSCYCGQTIDPKMNPNIIGHGCDNVCLKKGKHCDHKCSILCHPGPCPDCNVMVSRYCGCGSTQQIIKCCSDIKVVCDSVCNKLLECNIHRCMEICHVDSCATCTEKIIQECYCGKTSRKVECTSTTVGISTFECENVCGKPLPCGNHFCSNICHSGPCEPCPTDVNLIKHCYCGKTPLETPRQSCLDPIPICNNVCNKLLICGPPSQPHVCKEKCHQGNCPPCPKTTLVRCRCGHMDKEVPCQMLTTKADDARCEKKCSKKRLCGKHVCKQKCCIDVDHICPLPCNKLLTCGLHRCEMTCHSGRCLPCQNTSFEELYCECGMSVLYPPVSCGTKPPSCKNPCSKPRECGHPPNHDCHPGGCPPCFVLTKKWCFGMHEQRAAIPCNQSSFSCGLACGKPLPCGRHACIKPCHEGACPVPCSQPCSIVRLLCGHACNKPCHKPPCPDSNCKTIVPVTCLCGLQKATRICMELVEEYRHLEMTILKDKISSNGEIVNLADLNIKKPSVLKILDCNDECKHLERNRRFAMALQIQNPDLSQKLTPRYSDFLKQWAKKDSRFCQRVHEKLSELVQLAKQSKQKSRSHSFESMNRDKRHFIHEYCEHFGVESAAYDAEPNRNVVATAVKDKSWLPSMSLLEVIQRENGQRKVPGPILGVTKRPTENSSLQLLTIKRDF